MQRLRTTFKRSRTPTGAEMKTQSSLEVPKQVRSASFDEIQLEAQRNQQVEGKVIPGFLNVPQESQRSKSFDSGGVEPDPTANFLDVPRRFVRRRSSGDKSPPPCVHCLCLEEYTRQASLGSQDSQENPSVSFSLSDSDSSYSEDEEGDDEGAEDDDVDDVPPPPPSTPSLSTQCCITVTLSPGDAAAPEEGSPALGTRRRSITRQEALVCIEPPENSSLENVSDVTSDGSDYGGEPTPTLIVSEFFLKVPDLKRDRAASVDSCFSKVSSNNKTEELEPVNSLEVPQVTLRSRSVDIVLPTNEQARYKALAMTNAAAYPPGATYKG